MAKTSAAYACTQCGWQTTKWVGRCGECQQWNTVEERGSTGASLAKTTRVTRPSDSRRALPITQLDSTSVAHRPTTIGELDRVLGGGIVPGAAVLFSGEPGVGKSTLLLDVAARIASLGAKVLYASGEESTGQIRMRAERTGALEETLYLASETDLSTVLGHIDEVQPAFLVVDSVQTLVSDQIDGIAGGTSQVREVAAALIRVAKDRGIPVFLVGHVTKDGSIAGPRLLEHLVDVVCHFEGDANTSLRFLRTLKNRFGPTDEVGCFEMAGDGIREVADPSGLFLSQSSGPVSGTCTTVSMEGRRALPAEIQALVAKSATPNPRRVTSGVDPSRVAMILAVLERRAGVRLHDQDVYVSTVGGVRLVEPAADLAIALAIVSAATDTPLSHELAAFGELSLAGEIRPVTSGTQRANEASRLGYTRIIDASAGNLAEARRLAS
ncbi:DNA repair protein RadA [Leucobacter sp. cx-328]|uniref:DNA repair protein RadA n=1 Tax=unclassified Leucobacter TaxID=2621730 RepID=UPI00165DB11D|nr:MULTISPECIES: DNA repair protein RadA [unclassified Leucobacter]MBC9945054.1 DNA repair protein RadA [Leucobacter sp. cx-328]